MRILTISNIILIALFIAKSNCAFGQSMKIDSLINVINKTDSDTARITLMNELISKLKDIDSKQALDYAKQSLELSRQIKDQEKEIKALHNLGLLTYDSDKKTSSVTYFLEGERKANELGLKQLQSDHLMSLANYYRYCDVDSTKTANYLLKSIEVSKEGNYTYGTARSYAKLASFYTRHKQIQLCEEYLKKSADYYMQLDGGAEEIAHYYDEVGNKIWNYNPKKSMDFYFTGLKYMDDYPNIKVSLAEAYNTIGEPQKAFNYLKKAIAELEKIEYNRMKGVAFAKLSEVYINLGDHEAALETCNKGIALLSPLSMSNQTGLPSIYRVKAHLMELEGNDNIALKFYIKSLNVAQKNNEIFEFVKSNIALGKFYLHKDAQKSKKYCENAKAYAEDYNSTSLEIAACDCLYNFYKENDSYSNALKYFERKVLLSDSLGTIKVEHALDINTKMAEKDKQISKETYQRELKEAQLKSQYRIITILLIASLLGLILIGFLIVGIRKISNQNLEIKSKTNELEIANQNLAQSNDELERFAHVASHDLKSPLNNIRNFTSLLRGTLEKERKDSVIEWLDFIENSGKRMSQLIDDILKYAKLSSQDSKENKYETVNLNELVDEISNLISSDVDNKQKNIKTSNLPSIKWNHSKLFLLFKNLIENGLKYNESKHPKVKVHHSKTEGIDCIYFEDNGIGIEKEHFDKVFVMFQRLHSQSIYEGTGLGLATCKKIVDEFKGKINIESKIGIGTVFKIEIPAELITSS